MLLGETLNFQKAESNKKTAPQPKLGERIMHYTKQSQQQSG
jgi:hypothetical protein